MNLDDKGAGEPRQPVKTSLVKDAYPPRSKKPPVTSRFPAATTAPGSQGVGRGRGRGRPKQQQLQQADKTCVPQGGASREELDESTIVDG